MTIQLLVITTYYINVNLFFYFLNWILLMIKLYKINHQCVCYFFSRQWSHIARFWDSKKKFIARNSLRRDQFPLNLMVCYLFQTTQTIRAYVEPFFKFCHTRRKNCSHFYNSFIQQLYLFSTLRKVVFQGSKSQFIHNFLQRIYMEKKSNPKYFSHRIWN